MPGFWTGEATWRACGGVEKSKLIDGSLTRPKDVLIGIASRTAAQRLFLVRKALLG